MIAQGSREQFVFYTRNTLLPIQPIIIITQRLLTPFFVNFTWRETRSSLLILYITARWYNHILLSLTWTTVNTISYNHTPTARLTLKYWLETSMELFYIYLACDALSNLITQLLYILLISFYTLVLIVIILYKLYDGNIDK